MNKYKVYLADNYNKLTPFVVDWDYELLGDKLRSEFDVYFKRQEDLANAGGGKSTQLLKGEFVKRFMISKKINLVDDPSNGNLRSVFVLRKGEEKIIDERAKNGLAVRFEHRIMKNSDGTQSDPLGFMKFELVEGSERKDENAEETFQVSGNDIQYFQEEEKSDEISTESEEKYACEVCGKEFKSQKALNGHKLSHKTKK